MKLSTEVMSLIGLVTGISSLIFSGVTWKMAETGCCHSHDINNTQHAHKNHTHKEMIFIPMLVHQNGITKVALKRLDKDVGALFEDLGKAYAREKMNPKELQKSMTADENRIKSETWTKSGTKRKKTYEKINDNTKYIEVVYKDLNSRVIAVRKIADRNTKEIEKTRMFLKNHGRNVSET